MKGDVKHHNFFNENYNGVLTHDGAVKVAKTYITATIKDINQRNILVKGNKGSYVCEIHKDLYSLMDYVSVGDTAFIKFRGEHAWFVGYQKANYDRTPIMETGDKEVSENMSWMRFLKEVDVE